jgi:hypothetical protein
MNRIILVPNKFIRQLEFSSLIPKTSPFLDFRSMIGSVPKLATSETKTGKPSTKNLKYIYISNRNRNKYFHEG